VHQRLRLPGLSRMKDLRGIDRNHRQ
jgi:hypothetical protein